MLVQEVLVDGPRRVLDDLVDPLAVPDGLVALGRGEDWGGFILAHELIGADADHEVG